MEGSKRGGIRFVSIMLDFITIITQTVECISTVTSFTGNIVSKVEYMELFVVKWTFCPIILVRQGKRYIAITCTRSLVKQKVT